MVPKIGPVPSGKPADSLTTQETSMPQAVALEEIPVSAFSDEELSALVERWHMHFLD